MAPAIAPCAGPPGARGRSAPGLARVAWISGRAPGGAGQSTRPGPPGCGRCRSPSRSDADDPPVRPGRLQPDPADLGAGWALSPTSSRHATVLVLDRAAGLVGRPPGVGAVDGAGLVGEPVVLTLAWTAPLRRRRSGGTRWPAIGRWHGRRPGARLGPGHRRRRQASPPTRPGRAPGGTRPRPRATASGVALRARRRVPCRSVTGATVAGLADRTLRPLRRPCRRSRRATDPRRSSSAAVLVDATAPVGRGDRTARPDAPSRWTPTATCASPGPRRTSVAPAWRGPGSSARRPRSQRPVPARRRGYAAETGRVAATSPLLRDRARPAVVATAGRSAPATSRATPRRSRTGTILVDATAPAAPAVTVAGRGRRVGRRRRDRLVPRRTGRERDPGGVRAHDQESGVSALPSAPAPRAPGGPPRRARCPGGTAAAAADVDRRRRRR